MNNVKFTVFFPLKCHENIFLFINKHKTYLKEILDQLPLLKSKRQPDAIPASFYNHLEVCACQIVKFDKNFHFVAAT